MVDLLVGESKRTYRFVKPISCYLAVEFSLLSSRAWVMQERLLARRVLHFGKRQKAWECCEEDSAANEEHPTGVHIVEDNTGNWNTKAQFETMDSSNAVET